MRSALGVPDAADVDYAITVREGLLRGLDLAEKARRSRSQGKLTPFWTHAIVAWDELRRSIGEEDPAPAMPCLAPPQSRQTTAGEDP